MSKFIANHLVDKMLLYETSHNILLLIILTSLWCNGLTFLAENDEPLEGIRKFFERGSSYVHKPLISCISCMASVHSAIVMVLYGWIFHCLSWEYMRQYFLVAVPAIFLNGVLYLIRKNMEHVFFKNKKEEQAKKLVQ